MTAKVWDALCNKYLYVSSALATQAATRVASRFELPLRVYQCPRGYGYHLTKQVEDN